MQRTKRSLFSDTRKQHCRKHWWIGCLFAFLVMEKSCNPETWASTDHAASEKTLAPLNRFQLHDGLLTAQVTATPLPQVLSEISRLSGAKVVWFGQPDHRPVSATFTSTPVAEALQRVLGANNFLLVYAATAEKARLKEIWVVTPHATAPSSTPSSLELGPPMEESLTNDGGGEFLPESTPTMDEPSTDEIDAELEKTLEIHLTTASHGTDRDKRIEAIGFLGGLVAHDPRIRPLLQQLSTGERDPEVRSAAAELLAGLGE